MEQIKNKNTIKVKSKDITVENFLSFKDGDFIISIYNGLLNLYDGKSLRSKQIFKYEFKNIYILTEKEFAIIYGDRFEIYNFNEDRTSHIFIQSIIPNGISTKIKLDKLLNGDILFYSYNLGSINIEVFRKNINNNSYENQYQFLSHDLDGIIDINKSELLGYQYSISGELLTFKILNNENYKVKKQNKIETFSVKKEKKRIYLNSPILIKVEKNKVISFGGNNIYIFEIDNLELETTISLTKTVVKVLIRPKGILIFSKERIKHIQLASFKEKYYLNNIIINFDYNDIIQNNEKDITDKLGEHKTLFEVYNYQNNGLAIINENQELTIYDNYDL